MRFKTLQILPLLALSMTAAMAQNASPSLKGILGMETIGMNLAYLEKKIGPAKKSSGNFHQFDTDQCQFEVMTDDDNRSISMVTLQISKNCSLSLKDLELDEISKPTHQIAFKDIDQLGSQLYKASCLYMCSNHQKSEVFYLQPGSSANGNIEILYSYNLDQGDASKVYSALNTHLIKQFGEDFVREERYNCFDNKAHEIFPKHVRQLNVHAITWGHQDLPTQYSGTDCETSTSASATNAIAPAVDDENEKETRRYIVKVIDQVKNQPAAFKKQCMAAEISTRMEFGGEDRKTAQKAAEPYCAEMLKTYAQCVKQGGEKAIACIRETISDDADV